VVHRDVKPANLLLDNHGTAWVTDFGLAKAADGPDLTNTGDVVGTLRYLPPERFEGHSDARGDVYSLGLTLYELLTLRPAFEAPDRSRLIHAILHASPPRPRAAEAEVPRDLETVVLKAMEREPGRRYQTAGDLAEDLRRFLQDVPIRAHRPGVRERLWRWARRNPALATAGGVAVAAVLGFLGLAVAFAWTQARTNDRLTGLVTDLTEQETQTRTALGEKADALRESQRLAATMALRQAYSFLEKHGRGPALLWLGRALEAAPPDDADLQRVLRVNLAALCPERPVRSMPRRRARWRAAARDGVQLRAGRDVEDAVGEDGGGTRRRTHVVLGDHPLVPGQRQDRDGAAVIGDVDLVIDDEG
jgi:hypothetical protein